MKYFLSLISFSLLMLFLSSCSDDSSSNADTSIHSSSKGSVNIRMEGCKENSENALALAKEVSEESDTATYYPVEPIEIEPIEVHNLAMISCFGPCHGTSSCTLKFYAMDYCGIVATIKYRLSGDTLSISYGEDKAVSSCTCHSTHYFEIDNEYADAKSLKYDGEVYDITGDYTCYQY